MIKISIIVPIYNVTTQLQHCLDSLLCQTYPDFEVIGVDDGSSDDSADIFASYLFDKRFKLIVNYENQGLPSARNIGILHARGEFLFFVDSDDWLAPDALQTLLGVAERDKVDMVIGGVAKYHDQDGRLETPENHGKVMAIERIGVDISKAPELFHSVTSWNKLIRTDFVKDRGLIFKTTPRIYEDMLTYKWYLSGARISTISKVTYFYRQRDPNTQSKSIMQDVSVRSFTDKMLSFLDVLSFVKTNNIFLTDLDPLHNVHGMMNLPRALSWMLPKVFSLSTDNERSFLHFVMAVHEITLYFDEKYMAQFSDQIRSVLLSIKNKPPCYALEHCRSIFSK